MQREKKEFKNEQLPSELWGGFGPLNLRGLDSMRGGERAGQEKCFKKQWLKDFQLFCKSMNP